jgi:PAS domain S-box-containing protein
MNDSETPTFDFGEEREEGTRHLQAASTETLDLSHLFSDVASSGTFDLSAISSSTLGRLLDALPIPAVLVDQFYQVGFANQSCEKISPGYEKIRGVPFADLVPLPKDPQRAQILREKIQTLIQRAFETRKPRVAEAILEIENKRIWARLHLRSVKIGLDRYVLLTIEDLTFEKRQLLLKQRQDEIFRRATNELRKRTDELTEDVRALNEQVRLEMARRLQVQESLRQQEREIGALWERVPFGLVVVETRGFIKKVNPRFSEMFGYDAAGLSENFERFVVPDQSGEQSESGSVSEWVRSLGLSKDQASSQRSLEVRSKNGDKRAVTVTAVLTLNEGSLLIFDTSAECGE